MTALLLDTNVLLRYVEKRAPEHDGLRRSIELRLSQGDALFVMPQVLIEFWVVVTRPLEANGFGWEPAAAATALRGFVSAFRLLPDGS